MTLPRLELQAIGPPWVEVLILACTAAVWGYALYATRFQPAGVRWLIGALRTLLLGFGLLLLHHPTLTRQVTQNKERRLAVLLDRSGSMGAQGNDGQSRYQKAFTVAKKLRDDAHDFDLFEFDQTLTEPLGANLEPRKLSGNKTDFHRVLTRLLSDHDDYSSVLVLSDGHDLGKFTQMSSGETSAWLERLNAPPINTVLIGDQLRGPEVAIHSIDAPAFSYVRAPLRIRATVIVRNLDRYTTQAQLLESDKVLQIKDLVLDDQGFGSVEFEYYPEEEGEHLFTVLVPPHHLESNVENNSQQILVDIGRDKINVLHIAGSITWDLQGLRAMFERNPQVDLTAFYIMRTREHFQVGVDNRPIPHDEMALVPFPTEEIFDRQLFGFDVVVFHDFDAGTYFSDSYQARRLMKKIREFVTDHRGGFVVIGGPRTAAGPSLALTPLAEILPLVPPIHRSPYDQRVLEPELSSSGSLHPIVRQFNPKLHRYDGVMRSLTLNKSSNMLVQDPGGTPLLVTAEPGNGRTLFLNTSSSWKWRRDSLAEGRTGEGYYDFWDQVLKWVIQDPSMYQTRITSTKTIADPLSVDVDLLLRNADYVPSEGKSSSLRIVPLDAKSEPVELLFTTDTEGNGRTKYSAPRPGYYRIELTEEPWKSLSRPNTVFLGGSQDELRNLDLVPETMQRLASFSGGRFTPSAGELRPNGLSWGSLQQQTIIETQRLKLRNWIWTLPILILIAGLEWVLRRSRHLA